jgi:23S rRNA (cytosine1962-C5)-methyltransferase
MPSVDIQPADVLKHLNYDADFQAQRLFHGRGHAFESLSHINIDLLPPVILITLYKEVTPEWLQQLAQLLKQQFDNVCAVKVQYRCRQFAPFDTLCGEQVSQTIVSEWGNQYHIQLDKNQNTGLFLDMANGRRWVLQHSQNKRVLNLFAYTCAFSVAAIAGGASQVVNIDMSRSSLSLGRENHRLNQQDLSKVKFEAVDIFKSNSRIKKYGPYQLMICDPPSFQKGSVDIQRDYKKILKKIPQWLSPNADVLLCLNSPDLSEQFLQQEVAEYCPSLQLIERIATPPVFKEAYTGKGLKVLWFRYQPIMNRE